MWKHRRRVLKQPPQTASWITIPSKQLFIPLPRTSAENTKNNRRHQESYWALIKFSSKVIKGATKSYTQYSCVVIVLFNTDLCRSAFSTVSFRKLVFFVFLCFLWIKTLKFASSCYVILICNFVLTLYKKTHLL